MPWNSTGACRKLVSNPIASVPNYFQLGSSVHRPSLAKAAFAGPRSTTCSTFGFSFSFRRPISTNLLMVTSTISAGIPSFTGQTFAAASAS